MYIRTLSYTICSEVVSMAKRIKVTKSKNSESYYIMGEDASSLTCNATIENFYRNLSLFPAYI